MSARTFLNRVRGREKRGAYLCVAGVLAGLLCATCSSNSVVNRGGGGGQTSGGGFPSWGGTAPDGSVGFGGAGNYVGFSGGPGSGGTAGGAGPGMGGSSTSMLMLDAGGMGTSVSLVCTPGTLVVSGGAATVQCVIQLPDGTTVSNVVWTTDDTRIGSIGQDGVFRANGFVGGVVKVSATIAGGTITTDITVDVAIQNNTGGITQADITKLANGGTVDSTFKWLYPYDKTVFPRGLEPPELQFPGTCTGAMYLKITLPHFTYEQASAATAPLRIGIPPEIWNGVTLSTLGSDWVNVSVSKLCGGQVTGPIKEQWLIAPGKMKGIVYYYSYDTPDAWGFPNTFQGKKAGVVRLRLGYPAEGLFGNCVICHSVSANGTMLAASVAQSGDWSATYDLSTGAAPPPQIVRVANPRPFMFPALTPDGKRAFTSGAGDPQFNITVIDSTIVDTSTGAVIVPGLTSLYLPAFSPDGLFLAGTRLEKTSSAVSLVNNPGKGRLAMADYDGNQNPPTVTNVRDVVVSTNNKALGWPSFIPDSRAVVFQEGGDLQSKSNVLAELRLAQTASGSVNQLGALNGYLADGTTFYPPNGMAEDGQHNYVPTVLPRPIGGYYWVMFSSRRSYGNYLPPGATSVGSLIRRKIWVAAIDLDHDTKPDPSHPPFYLSGQPIEADAHRPFVALEPCKPEGASCESGADCCAGYCRETSRDASGLPVLQCVPPPPNSCSNIDEFCLTPADCCDQTLLCILNRCAIPTPPIY